MIGKGTKIGYTTLGGAGTPTPLAKVVTCSQPEVNVGNVDGTHYESPDGYTEKESVVWKDVSDLSLTLKYGKAQTATLYGLVGTPQTWTIELFDGAKYVFDGFISKLGGGDFPNKDVVKQPVTITITGKVVFTPGT